jgi:hypothetical protein
MDDQASERQILIHTFCASAMVSEAVLRSNPHEQRPNTTLNAIVKISLDSLRLFSASYGSCKLLKMLGLSILGS